MATWIGYFNKRKNTAPNDVRGMARVDWVEAEDILFTYSKAVDIEKSADAFAFRNKAVEMRDLELARQEQNVIQSVSLTNFMNS